MQVYSAFCVLLGFFVFIYFLSLLWVFREKECLLFLGEEMCYCARACVCVCVCVCVCYFLTKCCKIKENEEVGRRSFFMKVFNDSME